MSDDDETGTGALVGASSQDREARRLSRERIRTASSEFSQPPPGPVEPSAGQRAGLSSEEDDSNGETTGTVQVLDGELIGADTARAYATVAATAEEPTRLLAK